MKKLLLVGLMILLLSACKEKTNEIPLIIYDMNDTYMKDFEEHIKRSAEGKIVLKTYNSQNSQVIQNEYIEKVLKEGVPLLIVNPVDRLGAYTVIEKAKQYNTPIIFINREPMKEDIESWEHVYYVGADPVGSAVLQAEIVYDLFANPLNLNHHDLNNDNIIQTIILKGQQGHQDAEIRTESVIRTLEDYGFELEILEIKVANFDMETARIAMIDLLKDYGDQVELILSNNDAMAIGAIQTLIEEGYFVDENNNGVIDKETEPWLPVIGIDGLDISLDLIEQGYLHGTVVNDSVSMADAIVELATKIFNEEPISELSFPLVDEHYIWIEYKKHTIE